MLYNVADTTFWTMTGVFVVNALLSFGALYLALRYVRVWWAYLIIGEMWLGVGLTILVGVFGVSFWDWELRVWFSLYAIVQGVTVILLLFSLAKTDLVVLYASAAVLSLVIGGLEDAEQRIFGYIGLVGLLGSAKVCLMVHHWYEFPLRRSHCTFDRIHLWQD